MTYIRKTRDEYLIEQQTAQGWEEVCSEDTRAEARQRRNEYRGNQPEFPVRIRKVRVRKHDPIPRDFAVQPLRDDERPPGRCECGYCGLAWDDDKSTEWTPTPSGRCPFEYFHRHD